MPLDPVTEADVIALVLGSLAVERGGWVITANIDHLRQFVASSELPALFSEADLVVADGMPLIWASRLAGAPLPTRVAGSDLVWSLSAEAALHGRSIFLLGGAPGVAARAAKVLHQIYPALRLAGAHSPPFGFESDPEELDMIRAELQSAQPDIVYVALGFPKQERLIRDLREQLPETWFLGVGISLSFLTGDARRAPDWLQRIGLEWVHRLASEPRRLARRYLLHDMPFALRLARHSLTARLSGDPKALPAPSRRGPVPRVRVSFTHGALERRRVADLASLRPERH